MLNYFSLEVVSWGVELNGRFMVINLAMHAKSDL